jgi:hypothetical protein
MPESESDLLRGASRFAPQRGRQAAIAAVYSLLGGVAAGVLMFGAGLSFWALVVGAALTVGLAIATAVRSGSPQAIRTLLAYSLAFALLTWPVLLLAAGVIWEGPGQ